MGLRRTDFVLDKEVIKLISNDIEQGLRRDLMESLEVTKAENVTESNDESVREASEVGSCNSTGDTKVEPVLPPANVDTDCDAEQEKLGVDCSAKETSIQVDTEESGKTAELEKERSLTTKERIEQQLAEKEIQDQLNREQHEKYMAEMRRLYPTLPENFGHNDVEQAVAIKKDRLLDGKIFSNTWDLLSLSIHPDKAEDGPVYVLWDPDNTYVDQANFWIDTAWLSIKKPESMRTVVAGRNPASPAGS